MTTRFLPLLLLPALVVLSAPTAVAQARKSTVATAKTAVLPAGTVVVLETTTAISSKDAQVGQNVALRVKYDVIVKGKKLIKNGAAGNAQITSAEHSKGLGKEGSLSLRPSVVQAADGQMVILTGGDASRSGESKTGGSIALAAVVSPLFLLKKGKDATIPPGYEIQATVANPTEVDLTVE